MTEEFILPELTRKGRPPTLDVRMDPSDVESGSGGIATADRNDKRRTGQARRMTAEEFEQQKIADAKKRAGMKDIQEAQLMVAFHQRFGREPTFEERLQLIMSRGRVEDQARAQQLRDAQAAQQAKSQQENGEDEEAEDEPLAFQYGPLAQALSHIESNLKEGKVNKQTYHNTLAAVQGMLDRGEITDDDFDRFKKRIKRYTEESEDYARIQAEFTAKEGRRSTVRSIQEVALRIIADEGADRWGEGGVFPLLNKEGGLNQANFLRWIRERMMYYHDQDSTNYELNMFSSVGIQNEFGSKTPIITMVDNRAQFFKDAKSGEVLDDLANQVVMEIWLFGTSRNNDILYQFNMSNDEKLPEFLNRVHLKNEFTKGKNLQTIMSMAEDFGEKGDTKTGDAVRRGYEIYYHMSDFDKLVEILGEDSLFFQKEAFENAFRILEKKDIGQDLTPEAQKLLGTIFTPDGQVKKGEFIKIMNPFNAQEKDEYQLAISREMIRQVLADEYGLEYGLQYKVNQANASENDTIGGTTNKRDFLRKTLEYAELWAYSMTRWTGAGSNNDTDNIGFDAFTKTMRTRGYRIRQSQHTRAGQFGNEYNLGVMKGLTVDLLNAIRVEPAPGATKRYTPFEIITRQNQIDRQIRAVAAEGDESSPEHQALIEKLVKEKEDLGNMLRFRQFTQTSYASNHINRAFTVFHSLMGANELRLEEVVKWDPMRGLIYDRGKFEEMVKEGFLKPIRYAFSTYPGIDFGKTTREQIGKQGDIPIYKTVTLAEKMFGPEVLVEIKKKAYGRYKEILNPEEQKRHLHGGHLTEEGKHLAFSRYISDDYKFGGRSLLWKYAARARIAKELLSHREFGNGYQFFNHMMAEKFLLALESIKTVDLIEDDEETVMAYGEQFFNHEDINWIKNNCKLRKRDIFKEFGKEGLYGLGKGIWEGFEDFFHHAFK